MQYIERQLRALEDPRLKLRPGSISHTCIRHDPTCPVLSGTSNCLCDPWMLLLLDTGECYEIRRDGTLRKPRKWPVCPHGFDPKFNRHFVKLKTMQSLMPTERFGVIYADPPWAYCDLGHTSRIDRQCVVMTPAEIAALPVQQIALPEAVLSLWVPAPLLPDGFTVIKAWGFEYKSNLVWDKEMFGIGHYARIQHEHLLLCVRGKPGRVAGHDIPSVIRSRAASMASNQSRPNQP
jgi:N6-adenosine-specific RNA methylase IME4